MPSYRRSHEAVVQADAARCFAVLTDYERIPDWQGPVKRCTVVERTPDGAIVDYEVDAKVKTVRYRLRQIHEEPRRVGSEYLDGDFRDMDGEWVFDDRGDGTTHVTFCLRIDPGRFVPGRIADMLSERVMGTALRDFEQRVAEVAGRAGLAI